jgi:hypothetical protein
MSRDRGPFDLLLGSDIGLWIAATVDPGDVASIVTRSDPIADEARRRGMTVRTDVAGAGGSGSGGAVRFALSAHWPAVLTQADLALYEAAWNIHPGLLPWGRGYAPVFWALWAGEPAGASLHVMTAGLDKGPVVDQRQVAVLGEDTAATLYLRVLSARQDLFTEWWPRLVAGERPAAIPQAAGGSYHSRADFLALRDAGSVADLSADDLVRLCRALAMPGMPGPLVAPSLRLTLETDEPKGEV